MKRQYLFLFIIILAITSIATAQESPCEIDIDPIIALLEDAKQASSDGDAQHTLDTLRDARHLIQSIEAVCGASTNRSRVVMYITDVIRNMEAHPMPPEKLSTLLELATQDEIEVAVMNSEQELRDALRSEDLAGVYFAAVNPEDETLIALGQFADAGGRVIMVYDESWAASNLTLETFLHVTVVDNYHRIMKDQLPVEVRPYWMRGMDMRVSGEIDAYLDTEEAGAMGFADNGQGSQCLLFFADQDHRVFLPMIRDRYHNPVTFFDDAAIALGDHQEAALRLLRYLSGVALN